MLKNFICIFSILITFVGCSMMEQPKPHVQTSVTVFHEMVENNEKKSFFILPYTNQQESLEYKTYANLIKQELQKKGFIEKLSLENSDYIIFFLYGIDNGEEKNFPLPIIGQTGVSNSSSVGTINKFNNTYTLNSQTTNTPSYGVIGATSASIKVYTRFLNLDIYTTESVKNNHPQKVYEAKTLSTGSTAQVPKILPFMIKAIFENFPGENGSVKNIQYIMNE